MIYQLAKTSVGLSGQVKWNLYLSNSTVVDLQIAPIHESVKFNYTQREDTLNYTHIQNLNRLYKKIPFAFFDPVVNPLFNTGYPVRNNGARIETHENSYEMGMKRISYKRYGKQYAFFCPVWCDDKDEINNIVFRLVLKNDNGQLLSTQEIDHSLIKDYISQYVDEAGLDNNLTYLDFTTHHSWIKGVNVKDGRAVVKNTLGVIENLTSQERTILETDDNILSQFAKNNIVANQLFNFNFIFDLDDVILPQLTNDVLGEKINAYIDIYYNDEKIPVMDIYSNYDFIPRYQIYTNSYSYIKDNNLIVQNCLDYLKDYANVDNINKNKLVQSTFHWALQENPNYLFNLYDGCAPAFKDDVIRGFYYNMPNLTATSWLPENNPLGWCNPSVLPNGSDEWEVVGYLNSLFENHNDSHWCHFKRQEDNTEFYWINNIKYKNGITWNGESTTSPYIAADNKIGLCKNMYFNITYVPNSPCTSASVFINDSLLSINAIETSVVSDPYASGNKKLVFKVNCLSKWNEYMNGTSSDNNSDDVNKYVYIILGRSTDCREWSSGNDMDCYNMISFVYFANKESYLYPSEGSFHMMNFFINSLAKFGWKQNQSESQNTLDILTKVTFNDNNNINTFIKNNVRSLTRTISEHLSNIVLPDIITFNTSLAGEYAVAPTVKKEAHYSQTKKEIDYYKTPYFIYLFRYTGRLYPYFIKGSKYIYNNTYIVKQYNQQINVKDISDADMNDFNSYASTKYSPIYPSMNFFSLRKKKCRYNMYHRCKRRYFGEQSWYKKNKLFVLPRNLNINYNSSSGEELNEDKIKKLFISKILPYLRKNFTIKVRNGNITEERVKTYTKEKKQTIIEHFIWPLYEYKYSFDYKDKKTIDKYKYNIKYTLK